MFTFFRVGKIEDVTAFKLHGNSVCLTVFKSKFKATAGKAVHKVLKKKYKVKELQNTFNEEKHKKDRRC